MPFESPALLGQWHPTRSNVDQSGHQSPALPKTGKLQLQELLPAHLWRRAEGSRLLSLDSRKGCHPLGGPVALDREETGCW